MPSSANSIVKWSGPPKLSTKQSYNSKQKYKQFPMEWMLFGFLQSENIEKRQICKEAEFVMLLHGIDRAKSMPLAMFVAKTGP